MISVDFNIADEKVFFDNLANVAFDVLGHSGNAVIELEFVSESEIKKINKANRNIDKATDVLSFPYFQLTPNKAYNFNDKSFLVNSVDGNSIIGSIIICDSIAKKQASEYNHSETRERGYLFIHGLLHILGYDHMTEDDKLIMREKEELILSKQNIKR